MPWSSKPSALAEERTQADASAASVMQPRALARQRRRPDSGRRAFRSVGEHDGSV
jgi:hypothetical protein